MLINNLVPDNPDNSVYKPFKFFILAYLLSWIPWFWSVYFSYRPSEQAIFSLLFLPGLLAPSGVALWMIFTSKDRALKENFVKKLFDLRLIKISTLPAIFFITPVAVIVSILVSTFFGQPINQLQFVNSFSFSAGFLPTPLVLVLAGCVEELGWRSYGVDSLNAKYNYFMATLIFAFLWAFWHLPMFFVKGYYHYELISTNIWFAVNFMVSVLPITFIIGWIWRKNNRSILTAMLFHSVSNISQEALQMSQISKCIETGILLIIAIIIVVSNKEMFFGKPSGKQNAALGGV